MGWGEIPDASGRRVSESRIHPDAKWSPPESRVERYPEPGYSDDVGLGAGPLDEPGTGRVGDRPMVEAPKQERLARARAVLGGHAVQGVPKSKRKPLPFVPSPQMRAAQAGELGEDGYDSSQESRVEYDYEALRASKRSGNDSGRGL